jgi:hypothetical protein
MNNEIILEKYKQLYVNQDIIKKEEGSLNKVLLSLLIHKNSCILQLGNVEEKLENFVLEVLQENKHNYVKMKDHHFNLMELQHNKDLKFDILVLGYSKNLDKFLDIYYVLYEQLNGIYIFYNNDFIKFNSILRKKLNVFQFYSIGHKLIKDKKKEKNSIKINNQYFESEIFMKGQNNGLKKINKMNNEFVNINVNVFNDLDFKKIDRTFIIQYLINKYKLENYLEIGVRDGVNFDKIKVKHKIGVDPKPTEECIKNNKNKNNLKICTSDTYFKELRLNNKNGNKNGTSNKKFDIIFIDGLHLEYQVDLDIQNSLDFLSDNGFIIMHDCNPPTKFHQRENYVLKDGSMPFWNGTVWRSYVKLRMNNNNDLKMNVINCDWGVGILRKKVNNMNKMDKYGNYNKIKLKENFTYSDLNENREYILNLISIYEFFCKF